MSEIFADGTKIFRSILKVEDADSLQDDINSLTEWCAEWGMLFNVDKCKIMHYGKKNPGFIYHINGQLLEVCDTYKDLGVIISKDLKVAQHIESCIAKANIKLGMIKRTFEFIDKEIFLKTYKTFVRPLLEYCQEAWAPHLAKDITSLENVQRRATKLVSGLKTLSYEERLKSLNLFKLSDRRERGDMISMYKIMHNLVNIDANSLFQMNNTSSTRGHLYKLYPVRNNTDIRRCFYTQRVVAPWNRLPNHVVTSNNVSQFKRSYDNYIKQNKL